MGPRPVDPAAPDARAKAGSSGENERRQYRSHLFPFDILEDAVALTAARLLEVSRWAKGEPRKNLHQLVLERFATHQQRPGPDGRELAIPGQKPTVLGPRHVRKNSVRNPWLQVGRIETKKPQPPRQRAEHGVT